MSSKLKTICYSHRSKFLIKRFSKLARQWNCVRKRCWLRNINLSRFIHKCWPSLINTRKSLLCLSYEMKFHQRSLKVLISRLSKSIRSRFRKPWRVFRICVSHLLQLTTYKVSSSRNHSKGLLMITVKTSQEQCH